MSETADRPERDSHHLPRSRLHRCASKRFRCPKGGELQAEIIRHPGSVVIIPVTAQDEIILVRQYRPAIGRWAWELPAGSLKPGEDVERAARRECQEETGQMPSRLERVGSYFPTPGYCDEEMTFFKATGLRTPGPGR